jgi:hypothetical protein
VPVVAGVPAVAGVRVVAGDPVIVVAVGFQNNMF